MFARVTRVKGATDKIETVVASVSKAMLPAVEGMAGFSGGFLLANRLNGEVMTITLWQREQDVKASEQPAANWRASALTSIQGIVPPEMEIYEAVYLPSVPEPEKTVSVSLRPGTDKFARVTRIRGTSGQIDAVIRQFTSVTVPAESKLPGYAGGMLFVDRQSGKLIFIFFWMTEADLVTSTVIASAQRTEIATLSSAIAPVEVTDYELVSLPMQVPG